jgi:predicted nucleic acid-binding protein
VFVLDASVALAWVLPDEGNAYADACLDRTTTEGAVVPPIWPLEVGNVLLIALRRGRVRREEFEVCVDRLASLPIEVEMEATHHALAGVLVLAAQYGLTTYDAAYVELAQRRSLPLATLDGRLRRAGTSAKVQIL